MQLRGELTAQGCRAFVGFLLGERRGLGGGGDLDEIRFGEIFQNP